MAKFLNDILAKALPKPVSEIKKSLILNGILANEIIPENHIMISLDVTSLFTNVPTELFFKGIDKRCPLIKKIIKFQID